MLFICPYCKQCQDFCKNDPVKGQVGGLICQKCGREYILFGNPNYNGITTLAPTYKIEDIETLLRYKRVITEEEREKLKNIYQKWLSERSIFDILMKN